MNVLVECPPDKPFAFARAEHDDLCFDIRPVALEPGDIPSKGVSCGGPICGDKKGLIHNLLEIILINSK